MNSGLSSNSKSTPAAEDQLEHLFRRCAALQGATSDRRTELLVVGGKSMRPRPTHEEIARRAYELFLKRGGAHGRELDDWLEAEKQL